MGEILNSLKNEIERLPSHRVYGQVSSVLGMLVEVSGVEGLISIGDHCRIEARNGRKVTCEVVGFREKNARVMPFGTLEGIGFLIWDNGFVNQNLRVFYSATVFSIFITSFFFFVISNSFC